MDPVYGSIQLLDADTSDPEIPGGFSFHRKSYSVRQGSRKQVLLRARFDRPLELAPPLRVVATDASVVVVRNQPRFEPVAGAMHWEAQVLVEGRKLNGRTTLVADCDGRRAECSIRVTSKDEDGIALEFELVPYSLGENYRAVWSRTSPNRLEITTQHESTSRYLGAESEGWPGQSEQPFQVLLAELISDNICRRIAEAHARALPGDFDADALYVLHNKLMKEFTPLAHRILVTL